MPRPVTLFTGQWADLPLTDLAPKAGEWGFDGLELACWGDHFDVDAALADDNYCRERRELLESHGLNVWAIGNHLVGQAVCDRIDARHQGVVPPDVWGDGDPEGVRQRAAEKLKDTARAAAKLGVTTVTGFTGSPTWHMLYSFPPNDFAEIERGYEEFAERFSPIIDVFDAEGVKFALEVHPTEIAYDFVTTRKTLDAIDNREGFGINFDPSHFEHQFLDSAAFVTEFADRIYHVHVKDSIKRLDGRRSILGGHLNFGEEARGWDFVSPGHGDVDFEALIRALNRIGYQGPLSIEWEDSGMDRDWGAPDALAFVRASDFAPSEVAFDAAFERHRVAIAGGAGGVGSSLAYSLLLRPEPFDVRVIDRRPAKVAAHVMDLELVPSSAGRRRGLGRPRGRRRVGDLRGNGADREHVARGLSGGERRDRRRDRRAPGRLGRGRRDGHQSRRPARRPGRPRARGSPASAGLHVQRQPPAAARDRHTLGVAADRVEAWVLGEHGDRAVPIFSRVRVDGEPVTLDPAQRSAAADFVHGWYRRHVALDSSRSSTWTSGAGLARMLAAGDGEPWVASVLLRASTGSTASPPASRSRSARAASRRSSSGSSRRTS